METTVPTMAAQIRGNAQMMTLLSASFQKAQTLILSASTRGAILLPPDPIAVEVLLVGIVVTLEWPNEAVELTRYVDLLCVLAQDTRIPYAPAWPGNRRVLQEWVLRRNAENHATSAMLDVLTHVRVLRRLGLLGITFAVKPR